MINRVKGDLEQCIEKSDYNYYEEQVYMLTDLGYDVEYADEDIKDVRRWETDTEYVYKITDKETKESIFMGILDTSGNTESQESEGITEIYEVFPIVISTTVYVREEQ